MNFHPTESEYTTVAQDETLRATSVCSNKLYAINFFYFTYTCLCILDACNV